MSINEIRWGIIGCGDVTEIKSGPALQKANRSSLVAVMRRDGDKARNYAARHNVGTWYDDAQALIDDENVNAIYIATPPASHCELTLRALAAGKPVLVEKPMALSTDECDTMIAAAKNAGQSLIVAYYRRALPRFEKMRQLVEQGEIGPPRLIQITQFMARQDFSNDAWRLDPAVSGGGAFMDMQSHTLDWLHANFGDPTKINGFTLRQAGDYPAEDFVTFTGQFGDLPVAATCAYTVGNSREDVTIHGENGSVSMSFFAHSPITLIRNGQTEIIDAPDPAHMHQPFIETIVAHLLNGAPNPCSGEDARVVNQVLAQIY